MDKTLRIRAEDDTSAATSSAGRNFDRLSGKVDKASKATSKTGVKWQKLGDSIKSGSDKAAIGILGIGAISTKMAADAEQSIGGVGAVFGKYAKTVVATSKKASTAVGLSADEYRTSATLIGAQLRNQGVAQDRLAGSTQKLIRLASDFSATYGGSVPHAVEAVNAALKGEFERLEEYGVSIKQSTVNTEKFRLAHVKTLGAFNKLSQAQQKAATRQAIINLVYGQGEAALGQFGRETDTAAHKQAVLIAKTKDLGVKLGNILLPHAVAATEQLDKLAGAFEHNNRNATAAAVAIGGAVATIQAAKFGPLAASLVGVGSALAALEVKFPKFAANLKASSAASSQDFAVIKQELSQFWRFIVSEAQDSSVKVLSALDKLISGIGSIPGSPFAKFQAGVKNALGGARKDMDRTKAKWAATDNAISRRQIVAKLKADKKDLEAKVATSKAKLATVHNKKTEAKIKGNISDAEAKIRSIKAQIAQVKGKTVSILVKLQKQGFSRKGLQESVDRSVGPSSSHSWGGADGGAMYRTGGPQPVNVEAPIIDVRAFLDSTEIAAAFRSIVVDENRRNAHRARVGARR